MKEFRVVVSDVDVLVPDTDAVADFTNYYLSREERIRHFTRHRDYSDKWFRIRSEPGMILKKHEEISGAGDLVRGAILVIEKRGIGRIDIDGLSGYAEHLRAMVGEKIILDEIHIEFEADFSEIGFVKQRLNPLKVIESGLFDYCSSRASARHDQRQVSRQGIL